jgi:hypothetical protein
MVVRYITPVKMNRICSIKTTINDFAIDVVASIIKCQISVHL